MKGAHCTGNQRQGRDNGWVHYIYYTKPIESRAITFQATTDHLMKNRSEIAKTRKELINNQPTRKITRIDEMTEDLNLKDFLSTKTGELSSGQKNRVSLAKSLINKPKLLFLDEPTASLDPDVGDFVREYLENYNLSEQ